MLKIYKQHTFASSLTWRRYDKAGVGLRPCLCTARLEGDIGGEPEAAAFRNVTGGGAGAVAVLAYIVQTVAAAIGIATQEVLVEQVIDGRLQGYVLCRSVSGAEVKQAVGAKLIAHLIVDCCIVISEIRSGVEEAQRFAAILVGQPGFQAVGGLPVEAGIDHV